MLSKLETQFQVVICDAASQLHHTRLCTTMHKVVQDSAKTVEKCNINRYLSGSSPVNRATLFPYKTTTKGEKGSLIDNKSGGPIVYERPGDRFYQSSLSINYIHQCFQPMLSINAINQSYGGYCQSN